ncbi:MAG: DUF6252 family protein [Bacteroidales bacterium]|nr:DUF6252 family protein [Bacteroidales bacterium]
MRTSIIIFASIIAFSSCKKDSKINDIVNPTASFTCKINGTQWTAITRVTRKENNKFIITGTGSLGSDVLNITTFGIEKKTYTLSPVDGKTEFSATFTNDTQTTDSLYQALYGTVAITALDTVNKKISGTFQFRTSKIINPLIIKEITNGSFNNLTYTE